MHLFSLAALSALIASFLMVVLYGVQRFRSDASIVDVGFTLGLFISAVLFGVAGQGAFPYRLAMMTVACLWSFRLAAYLFLNRILRGNGEDPRYRRLRQNWGSRQQINFFLFFQFQAILVVVFSIPMLAVAHISEKELSISAWLGVLLGLGAVLGETMADRQLNQWRANPAHKGKTCRTGLWRYSRHPNYFFEWLHWWAYVLIAFGTPWFWATLPGPLLMLLFLYRITGIPYAEHQALESRGEDYRRYQRVTSAFIPWPPTRSEDSDTGG